MLSYNQTQKLALLRPIIDSMIGEAPRTRQEISTSMRERWRQHSMAQTKNKYQRVLQLQHDNFVEKNELNQVKHNIYSSGQTYSKMRR